MKLKIRKTRLPMDKEELRKYYEQVKRSAKISEVKKDYKRSRDKKKVYDYGE